MTKTIQKLEFEYIAVEAIKTANQQIRKHKDRVIEKLVRSVARFGLVRPLIVDKENWLIDGHALLEAARRLETTHVPIVRTEDLSDAERRLLRITLNRLQELGEWDEDTLKLEFETLIELDPETELDITGFEPPEIDLILLDHSASDMTDTDDELPDIPDGPPISRLGDIWVLGEHRLICADATNPEVVEILLECDGIAPQIVISDPPWNVPISGHVGNSGKTQHREFAMASGEMSAEAFEAFLMSAMKNMTDAVADGGLLYLFIDWRHVELMLRLGRELGLLLLNIVVWNKTNGGMGSFYRSKHEFVCLFKKGKVPHKNNVQLGVFGRYRSNVWDYAGSNSFGVGRMERLEAHPTTKPTQMIVDAILDATDRGDIVFDSFCGSGSILLAAERTGRKARAIELDPLYVDAAVRRFEACYGKEAVLQETGQSFASMVREQVSIPSEEGDLS